MIPNVVKYIAAIFFITLYLLKGIAIVAPTILQLASGKITSIAIADTPTENEKNNTEERADNEVKELYLNHFNQVDFSLSLNQLSNVKINPRSTFSAQMLAASIPTPPPEV